MLITDPETIPAAALDRLRILTDDPDAEFRPDQLDAIRDVVVDRARVLCVQRTGWGKSAVYFVATALLRDAGAGPTLIISPLLALMRNQIAAAERLGLRAHTINSTNREEWDDVRDRLAAGTIDLLLISPERLNNPRFRDEMLPLFASSVGLLVIDEAHCISDWGHDFRPDYRRVKNILDALAPDVAVLGTTATANDRVVDDVVAQLGAGQLGGRDGDALRTYRGPLARASLRLEVLDLARPAERLAWLAENLPRMDGSGIVYTLTKRDAEQVAAFLDANGVPALAYSGEQETEAAEKRGEGGDHVFLLKIARQNFGIRTHAVDDQVGIDACERFADLGFHTRRVAGRPDHDVIEEVGEEIKGVELRIVVFEALCFGQPEHGSNRIFVTPGHVAYIAHDADDFERPGVLDAVHAEVLAEGVLVLEEAANERFVHDGYRAGRGSVLLLNRAALYDF